MVVPYQPNMSLAEQRAKKNEMLKNKVKKITGGSGSSFSNGTTFNNSLAITNGKEGQIDADTFITGTKIA